jgi:Uma2 family endonuclease
MTSQATPLEHAAAPKHFEPGTTGWTEEDLDQPEIDRAWHGGRYEIVEGVLTKLPAAYFQGSAPLDALVDVLKDYFRRTGIKGRFAPEADLVVNRKRVARVDMVFLTDEQIQQQRAIDAERLRLGRGRPGVTYGRLRIPPTLLIESASPGHEEHDRETKRRWYAAMGVRNYWMLDAFARNLECLALRGADYHPDATGREADEVRPPAFPGLVIPLSNIWL